MQCSKIFFSATLLFCVTGMSFAQVQRAVQYVNPFIGTTKTRVPSTWGSEGGTYPGAVAPSGYIQLTPETRVSSVKGYDFSDSAIYFFSCLRHLSGFPNGSSGQLYVMPVGAQDSFQLYKYRRNFSHQREQATPGYYSVFFNDNNTRVEATAATHTGMFRFTFPAQVIPEIFIGDAGIITMPSKKILHTSRHNAAIHLSKANTGSREVEGGSIFTFATAAAGATVIELIVSASTVGIESAEKNIDAEGKATGFDQLRQQTRRQWEKELAVVDINDSNKNNKIVFYTALYHSLLVPWIISDVEGKYRGHDGRVHTTKGKHEYGAFSPWDTFRSLHPLLCLLYPGKQKDMLLSMLDIFEQTGYLPVESMTGNHVIPIIVDSYLKGIKDIDSSLAYKAMKKSILTGPFIQPDMGVYRTQGYIPFIYPESVTRTVEYAYNDWTLAQFARLVMNNNDDYNHLLRSSYHYRNLFNTQELFLLPKSEAGFKLQPGTFGYKEGDAWIYSYFVPHNAKDLINLMGGNESFVSRLDEAMNHNRIVFDNETIFHVPYLFNAAGHAYKTQQWIRKLMRTRYSPGPDGLPGNDDLGSMSSWYVLSAMGIFPVCPGRPFYAIGSPVFRSITIHPENGKQFVIKSTHASPENCYVQSLRINHTPYGQLAIPHSLIAAGGEMHFVMGNQPGNKWPSDKDPVIFSETKTNARLQITGVSAVKKKVSPHEIFRVHFSVKNSGSSGTKTIRLLVNGHEYGRKNCLVPADSVLTDSIDCRLYVYGKQRVTIAGARDLMVEVIKTHLPGADKPVIDDLLVKPVIKKGEVQKISFSVQNIDGADHSFAVPILVNGSLVRTEKIVLRPGEKKTVSAAWNIPKEGMQRMVVKDKTAIYKVFDDNKASALLDLDLRHTAGDSIVYDRSGFSNNGKIMATGRRSFPVPRDSILFGSDCYIEVPHAPSLDRMGETMTMMAWIYPTADDMGLVDVLTKGDNHVLQLTGNKTLTFFAGGWGRGDCMINLPNNWKNNWHHIAGVCDGKELRVYMDGELKGSTRLEQGADLSVSNKWQIGRNEEFPLQRIFNGYLDKVKVFAAPLTQEEIKEVMSER